MELKDKVRSSEAKEIKISELKAALTEAKDAV